MIIVGNTDAHLKNWALRYSDRRTPSLAPVYDFHSLSVYSPYRRAPLALSLAGKKEPWLVEVSDFASVADVAQADPEAATLTVRETVARLREAWRDLRAEAEARFPALAEHYTKRLEDLPLTRIE